MTPEELRQKNPEALEGLRQDLKEEYFKLSMQSSTGQLEKTHRLKEVKRDIARVLTILKEKKKVSVEM